MGTALAVALAALLAWVPGAGAQGPPHATWRTLETEHVRVTFPEGYEALGREAAARAERAYRALSERLVDPPDGAVEILLTDHVDASNGSASVAPYPRVVVFARPPVDGFALSYFDDWLELVITHELAHVFHLDVTGPLGEVLRTVFGRVPAVWPFFPNRGTPRWTVEGLATWYESALTRSGRVKGTHHAMAVRAALLEGRFEGLGQVSGESPVWPAGDRPYIYGSLFFEHLLDEHGPERMGDFVEAVGDQLVPYRVNAAARKAFGVSFSDAWEAWWEDLEAEVDRLRATLARRAPLSQPEAVTTGARRALHAAVDPTGERLAYVRSDGRSDPQLRVAAPDGSGDRSLTRTNGTATFDWTPGGDIVFAQLEFEGRYHLRSDLYAVSPGRGVRRITRGARVDHPSVAPDGDRAVVVETGEGTTRLAEVDLEDGSLRPLGAFDPEVHWAYPAVSPDGRWIAASRWSGGAWFDVVVLDRDGRTVLEVTRDRALDLAPSWSPDGAWLVWSSDRSGIANLVAARVDPAAAGPPPDPAAAAVPEVRQVTNLLTGALFPRVDPEGRWIHFSRYHADGWEVERIPFEPAAWFEPFPLAEAFAADGSTPGSEPRPFHDGAVRPYRARSTLRPRFWQPAVRGAITSASREVVGTSFGAGTHARDLVGRHAVDVELLLSSPGTRLSGQFAYRYAGLGNPVLGLSASQGWDAAGPFRGLRADGSEERLWIRERERAVDLDATVLLPRFRRALSVRVGGGLAWEDRTVLDDDLEESEVFALNRPRSRLSSLQASTSFSTVRSHAFSVGPERGVSLFLLGRARRELDLTDTLRAVVGRDRSRRELLGRLRLFRDVPGPGYADHVLALRASAGVAEGPGADRFHFDVGGASGLGEPLTGFSLGGGRTYFFPARGYAGGERSGRYAWSATAEYRFPLALVHRGLGLFPLHLDRLGGTLFFDAADAWGPELDVAGYQNPRKDAPLTSVGAEALAEVLTFFSAPLTLRAGMAVRLDGGGTAFHLRLGRSF